MEELIINNHYKKSIINSVTFEEYIVYNSTIK